MHQGEGTQASRQRHNGQRSEGASGALEWPPQGKASVRDAPGRGWRGRVQREGRRLGKEKPEGALGEETVLNPRRAGAEML